MIAARPLISGENLSLHQFRGIIDRLYVEQCQESLFEVSALNAPISTTQVVVIENMEFPYFRKYINEYLN
jgi:hypothetical protein